MNSPNRSWAFPIITACTLVAISLPYILAVRATVETGNTFGGFLLNPLDGNSYLAKMMEGWRGEWLFTLPYTAEKGAGHLLYGFYLSLGHLSRLFGLSLIVTFHLARVAFALVLLAVLRRFFSAVLPDRRIAGLAFCLAALGSGLGWLALPTGAFTADFWVAETYPFLSAYANPHFPLGLALVLWLLTPPGRGSLPGPENSDGVVRDRAKTHLSLADRLGSALAALGLAAISPFGVVVVLAVLGVLLLVKLYEQVWVLRTSRDREFQRVGVIAGALPGWTRPLQPVDPLVQRLPWILLGGLPFLLYETWVMRVDPLLSGWNAQNLTPSPPLWDVVIALSPALVLALPGAWVALQERGAGHRLLVAWTGISLLLIYSPFGLQRRFMLGLYVPLAGLAALGIQVLAGGFREGELRFGRFRFLVALVCLLAIPTNLVMLLAARQGIQTQDANLYFSHAEGLAFQWLVENTPGDAVVLCAPDTGLLIPAQTGRRVIYGHPYETVNAGEEKGWVESYFRQGSPDLPALLERRIDFVFAGQRERQLNPDLSFPGLILAYQAQGVSIYAVSPGHQP